eukprot:2858500-Rhodomonas_salina.2
MVVPGLGQATIGRKVMKSGGTYRPKISPNCPISIQGLIEQCWDEDPDKRPTLAQVRFDLVDKACMLTITDARRRTRTSSPVADVACVALGEGA